MSTDWDDLVARMKASGFDVDAETTAAEYVSLDPAQVNLIVERLVELARLGDELVQATAALDLIAEVPSLMRSVLALLVLKVAAVENEDG